MLINNIEANYKHPDWQYVVDYAAFLKKAVTGNGLDSELQRFVPRETDEMFTQRCNVTQHITKPVLSTVRRPKQKISRITPIVKGVSYSKDKKDDQIEQLKKILNTFYGGQSLDQVLGERVNDLQDIDPNSFMLILFKDFDHRYEKPVPYFAEVSAEQAVDFQFINNVLQYLISCSDIQYVKHEGDQQSYVKGKEYIIYVDNDSVRAVQVDGKDYPALKVGEMTKLPIAHPEEGGPTTADFYKFEEERVFMFQYFTQKSGMVPAFRTGYLLDPETNGRTCISFLDPAIPYIKKTIKVVSEMDMGMTMHAFLQKVIYTPECTGYGTEPCIKGKDSVGNKCKACDGTMKKKVVTTTQDVIEIILPDPDKLEKAFDLAKMVHYVELPMDILEFENKYILQLKSEITQACYNTNVFVQNSISQTATEKLLDYESVYDTLYPAGVKYSQEYILSATIIANYNDLGKDLVVRHQYGKDLKFKTVEVLLEELKLSEEAKAPAFLRQNLNDDIAVAIYTDRPEELMRYNGMKRYDPFEGKTKEEIQFLITNNRVTKYSITLYAESKRIFQDLEDEAKATKTKDGKANTPVFFWAIDITEQDRRVEEKVNEMIDELEQDNPVVVPFDTAGAGAPADPANDGGAPPKPAGSGKDDNPADPNPADDPNAQ